MEMCQASNLLVQKLNFDFRIILIDQNIKISTPGDV